MTTRLGFEPGTSQLKVLGFTTGPVRSTMVKHVKCSDYLGTLPKKSYFFRIAEFLEESWIFKISHYLQILCVVDPSNIVSYIRKIVIN